MAEPERQNCRRIFFTPHDYYDFSTMFSPCYCIHISFISPCFCLLNFKRNCGKSQKKLKLSPIITFPKNPPHLNLNLNQYRRITNQVFCSCSWDSKQYDFENTCTVISVIMPPPHYYRKYAPPFFDDSFLNFHR